MSAIPLLIGGGIIALLAILMDSKKSEASTQKQIKDPEGPSPEDIAEIEQTFSEPVKEKLDAYEVSHNPNYIQEAQQIALSEGKDEQAAALKKAYDSARVESGTVTFISPINNLKPEFWTRFVNCVKGSNPKLITPGFALGLFGFGARRLVDVGLMTNPRQGEYKGKSVWTGDWVPPLTINKFLADSALQYQAFFASMRDYAQRIAATPSVRALIGRTVDGKVITLSGILGVCHKAGFSGMQKWFADPADRAKFTATTQAFNACNGIF